ncbi:MAG: hypothetical protein ACRDNE_09335 [Gaiellaceae bacterium]
MIVAAVALSFALAGSAVAGTGAVTAKLDKTEKKQVKKIAKKQANKQVNKREAGLNVNSAKTADSATTAGQLANLTVQRVEFDVADNTANGAIATCPDGQQVISGGVITGANDAYITNSVPANALIGELSNGETFSAWRGFVVNQVGGSGTITSTVLAVCAG